MQNKKSDNKIAITYTPVGKGTPFLQELIKSIPPQFKPTNKTSYIFSTLFAIVIGIGVFNSLVPFMNMDLSFDPNSGTNETKTFELTVNVGIPFSFFGSNTKTGSQLKMNPMNLLFDLIIYIILAYLIDVLFNFVFSLELIPSKDKQKQRPKEIQIQKRSMSEKAAEKITAKIAEKVTGQKVTETPNQATTTNIPTKTNPIPSQ